MVNLKNFSGDNDICFDYNSLRENIVLVYVEWSVIYIYIYIYIYILWYVQNVRIALSRATIISSIKDFFPR